MSSPRTASTHPRWVAPVDADLEAFDPSDVFAAGLKNHHISNTAYPIAHNKTWGPYRVKRDQMERAVIDAWEGIDDFGLYMHIPFCEVRCAFCEYTVVGRKEFSGVDATMNDLLEELALYRDRVGVGRIRVRGFDIGGGTPSFVPAPWIARIVEAAQQTFRFSEDSDISIETTPRIAAAEPDKISAYRAAGIDRISMGVQVTQPDLLRVLNRDTNGVEHHKRAVEHIRAAGFERFNIDLMYGFAGQTLASWRATLEHAIALGPEYITLYRMRYKLTRISHQAHEVDLEMIRPMKALSKEILSAAGYLANPGKTTYSRIDGDVGTSAYLARRVIDGLPYLGLGLGAQSFTDTTISYNDGSATKSLAPYHKSLQEGRLPIQDLYNLPACHMMAKMCCVSFYFGEIDRAAFAHKFGVPLTEAYPDEIRFLVERGYMTLTERALSMTPLGTTLRNGIIALFHAPSIKRHLLDRDPETSADFARHRRAAKRVASRGQRP